MTGDPFCTGCGRAVGRCPRQGACRGRYEPPRFCGSCGVRMAVRVTPTGWMARCRDHGETVG
ncbi:MAG: biotin synthase auxiliary protein BsaP [Acidimicrobiales bacterium]